MLCYVSINVAFTVLYCSNHFSKLELLHCFNSRATQTEHLLSIVCIRYFVCMVVFMFICMLRCSMLSFMLYICILFSVISSSFLCLCISVLWARS